MFNDISQVPSDSGVTKTPLIKKISPMASSAPSAYPLFPLSHTPCISVTITHTLLRARISLDHSHIRPSFPDSRNQPTTPRMCRAEGWSLLCATTAHRGRQQAGTPTFSRAPAVEVHAKRQGLRGRESLLSLSSFLTNNSVAAVLVTPARNCPRLSAPMRLLMSAA
jgi:hypothetical protein